MKRSWIEPTPLAAVYLTAALLWSTVAHASPQVERLEVSLWPDYDRPAVLVILRARLSPDTTLPTTLSLPMPSRAGRPHAVAKRAANGNLLTAQHAVVVEGDWTRVEITSDEPEIRLEYYIDFEETDPERRFIFAWPGGLDLNQVGFEVMQPRNASEVFISPEEGFQRSVTDGLTYQRREFGSQKSADTFFVGITYSRSGPALTASAPKPAQPGPSPQISQLLQLSQSSGLSAPSEPAQQTAASTAASETSNSSGNSGLLVALVVILFAALVGSWAYFLGRRSAGSSDRTGSPD
jgi:hypothetical protein